MLLGGTDWKSISTLRECAPDSHSGKESCVLLRLSGDHSYNTAMDSVLSFACYKLKSRSVLNRRSGETYSASSHRKSESSLLPWCWIGFPPVLWVQDPSFSSSFPVLHDFLTPQRLLEGRKRLTDSTGLVFELLSLLVPSFPDERLLERRHERSWELLE